MVLNTSIFKGITMAMVIKIIQCHLHCRQAYYRKINRLMEIMEMNMNNINTLGGRCNGKSYDSSDSTESNVNNS